MVHVAVQAETSAEKTTSVENKVENGISIVATRKRMKKILTFPGFGGQKSELSAVMLIDLLMRGNKLMTLNSSN